MINEQGRVSVKWRQKSAIAHEELRGFVQLAIHFFFFHSECIRAKSTTEDGQKQAAKTATKTWAYGRVRES
jgi:hypothetical protein